MFRFGNRGPVSTDVDLFAPVDNPSRVFAAGAGVAAEVLGVSVLNCQLHFFRQVEELLRDFENLCEILSGNSVAGQVEESDLVCHPAQLFAELLGGCWVVGQAEVKDGQLFRGHGCLGILRWTC